MKKFYDNFIQQKPKEMSKTLEDIVYKYINPETQLPTKVPASHFEKELGQEVEKVITESVSRQFLTIMYTQLNSLMKEDKELFYKALLCIDNNLNPKDLRLSEQIALNHTYDYVEEKQLSEKKEFHFFNQDISSEYDRAINDSDIQAEAMKLSNFIEEQEDLELKFFNGSRNNMSKGRNIQDLDDELEM